MKGKVFAALSGGVDSACAAILLIKAGYEVSGITMEINGTNGTNVINGKNGENGKNEAIGKNGENSAVSTAVSSAQEICRALKLKHYTFDFSREFEALVKTPFAEEYAKGLTPNPCVLCNRLIKWGLLFDKAKALGADFFATGHYVYKTVCENGRLSLARAGEKDQSYALYGLSGKTLEKTLFPLGGLSKAEVRKIVYDAGLSVHDKAESQDICFASEGYKQFLTEFNQQNPKYQKNEKRGEFVLTDGTVIGEHRGISNYTVGQRKGLFVSYSEPLFVREIDAELNRVVLGVDAEMYSKEFYVRDVNYMGMSRSELLSALHNNEETRFTAKIRYAHKGALCSVKAALPDSGVDKNGDDFGRERLLCVFDVPQRAIAPGQSAVLYNNRGQVLLGGVIEKGGLA